MQKALSTLAVAAASGQSAPLSDREIEALQRLDRVTQELEELGPLLDRLAFVARDGADPNVWAEAMQVRLTSLRQRMAGSADDDAIEIGEPELF